MDLHSIVILSLSPHTRREKIWGELLSLTAGVTLRATGLSSFASVYQVLHPEGDRVGLPTLFFPMTRVKRAALDEPSGLIPSFFDIFEHNVGRSRKGNPELFA